MAYRSVAALASRSAAMIRLVREPFSFSSATTYSSCVASCPVSSMICFLSRSVAVIIGLAAEISASAAHLGVNFSTASVAAHPAPPKSAMAQKWHAGPPSQPAPHARTESAIRGSVFTTAGSPATPVSMLGLHS